MLLRAFGLQAGDLFLSGLEVEWRLVRGVLAGVVPANKHLNSEASDNRAAER
jgi:hypothetical protein